MSYFGSIISRYRSENIRKDILEMLEDDYKWIRHEQKDFGIFFPIAFIGVMGLSVLKVPVFIYEQMKKPKRKGENNDCRY